MRRKSTTRRLIPRILITIGIILIAVTINIEVYNYPWRMLFGTNQDESSIMDPPPIILQGEDAGSVIKESDGVQAEIPTNDGQDENGLLPGSESENTPLSVYVQLGIIKIPTLNIIKYVLDGTHKQLRYGVGHVIGTDGIGARGNCVIAGHRSTVFRYLDKLSAGDSIILKVKDNVYTYSVYKIFAVLPDETWVLSDIEGEDYDLTLITCTPFLVSSHRLIVRARLTDINGIAPDEFYKENSTIG